MSNSSSSTCDDDGTQGTLWEMLCFVNDLNVINIVKDKQPLIIAFHSKPFGQCMHNPLLVIRLCIIDQLACNIDKTNNAKIMGNLCKIWLSRTVLCSQMINEVLSSRHETVLQDFCSGCMNPYDRGV